MLVLSRREKEVIVIGDDIRLMICKIRGGIVRIGIDAPEGTSVHRLEIYRRVRAGLQSKGGDGNGTAN